jgi:hypothetical protein
MVLGVVRFTEATPFSKGVRHADIVDTMQQARVVEGLKVIVYAQAVAALVCCSLGDIKMLDGIGRR